MNITEQVMPYRRGRILALLRESNDSGMSDGLLRNTLRAFGYRVDGDVFAADCAWLARHGMIVRREVLDVSFYRLTPRGRDVITGDLDYPGIQLIED